MDIKQNQVETQIPVQPTAKVPVQTPQAKFKNLTENLKEKFNKSSKNTKLIIMIVVVLLSIIFFLSILVALFGKKPVALTPIPSPTSIAVSPAPIVILGASRYATDSGVLKIEGDLNNIQKQLETIDVKQSDLNIPTMDFNITFSQ